MKMLLTGASGQFGSEFAGVVRSHDEFVALDRSALDVSNRDQTLQVIHAVGPDVIIHAGAWTNVDACESDPARAYLMNSFGTRNVAEAAASIGAHVVYLSSDYVFDGQPPAHAGGYSEWDSTNPQSAYGRSKLGGERELQMLGERACVLRTSWVVGAFGHNFVKTMLRLAHDEARPSPSVVNDQVGCPTFTADLAPMVLRLAVARVPGVVHVSNQGETNWFHFARAIFAAAGCDPERVTPTTTAQYMAGRSIVTAPRPAFSTLDHGVLRGLGWEMPFWDASLARVVAALT